MAERAVTQTKKDSDGDILALCNPSEYWSPRPKASAIQDIDNKVHSYYVPWKSGHTLIKVVNGLNGKYLRTDRDETSKNNLDDLPNC